MRQTAFKALLYRLTVLLSHSAEPDFPLKISENRRYLADAGGTPFLCNADTPWLLFTNLTEPEAKAYIARRKEQGRFAFVPLVGDFDVAVQVSR